MNICQFAHGFYFYNCASIHYNVCIIIDTQVYTSVFNSYAFLGFGLQTTLLKFKHQSFFIAILQKTWAKMVSNIKDGTSYLVANRLKLFLHHIRVSLVETENKRERLFFSQTILYTRFIVLFVLVRSRFQK